MKQEYARMDRVNEIQRKTVIRSVINGFNGVEHHKVVFNLYGNSGVGKSYICKSVFYSDMIIPEERKVLIDLNQIANNNIPGIIQAITAKFGFGAFYQTQTQLDKYFKSIDASKTECLAKCVNTFIKELNCYADDCGGVLLIFDTFEALSVKIEQSQFKQILEMTNNNVHFLIAGIVRADFDRCTKYHVSGFDETEIQEYLISRNYKMRMIFKKHGTLLASQIRKFTDGGNPILCGLVSDWLLYCHDINSQVDYLLSSNGATYKHLINWISNLNDDMYMTLRITAFFNDRMTSELLCSLSGMDNEHSRNCLFRMLDFSFVKSFSDTLDPEPQIVLHDVVAKLIREFFPFTKEQLYSFVEKAIVVYDQLILEDRHNIETFSLEQSLRVERVMCAVRNGYYENAFVLFDDEILDGIDYFNYSFVEQLINEVECYIKLQEEFSTDVDKENRVKWEYILQLAKAEEELSKYHAEEAVKIYKELKKNSLYKTSLYKALADDMFARALVNPCTIDCNETLTNAINMMNSSIKKIAENKLNRRLVKSYYWLGNAYVRGGQNAKAQSAYEDALSKSQTDIQKVMIFLDMSKMLRLQQDVREALVPLQKCDVLMENMKKNKGKYYYYKGNIYRDLDDIETATIYYKKAFEELADGDDNFTFCELNLDYAWLQYIRDDTDEIDIKEVQKYLDIGWKYAQNYHFGTEYSEYHHILYEILNYLGDYQNAYKHLDKAIDFAYQYSNIYMMLDCLNHRVQRYYREKKIDEIPDVIKEMGHIERNGCKIRVFRGRAKLVQADIYYDYGNYEMALQEYFDGFVIVALYGNSRTNVELFDDLYNKKEFSNLSRKEKINECLCRISEPDKYRRKFRNTWNKKNISREYRYFLDEMKNSK